MVDVDGVSLDDEEWLRAWIGLIDIQEFYAPGRPTSAGTCVVILHTTEHRDRALNLSSSQDMYAT